VASAKTITVDDDGEDADYHSIQEAINASESGDSVYVREGTYVGALIINKSIIILGEDANHVEVLLDENETINVISDHVTIYSLNIAGSSQAEQNGIVGITLVGNHSMVMNIIISECYIGILSSGTSDQIISQSKISNTFTGVRIDNCRDFTIVHCEFFQHWWGIATDDCSQVFVSDCVIHAIGRENSEYSTVGIWFEGYPNSTDLRTERCDVSGYGIGVLYLFGSYSGKYELVDTTVSNNGKGIHIGHSSTLVSNCTAIHNEIGIEVDQADDVIIERCRIENNTGHGVNLERCDETRITNCTIANNGGYGIRFYRYEGREYIGKNNRMFNNAKGDRKVETIVVYKYSHYLPAFFIIGMFSAVIIGAGIGLIKRLHQNRSDRE